MSNASGHSPERLREATSAEGIRKSLGCDERSEEWPADQHTGPCDHDSTYEHGIGSNSHASNRICHLQVPNCHGCPAFTDHRRIRVTVPIGDLR